MKQSRTYLFIALSSTALVIVLIIQTNWILQTAKIKEELFNEKAIMVLTRTAESLASDSITFNNLEISAGKKDVRKLDSLFNHYMKLYNIQIGYFFEVHPNSIPTANSNGLHNLSFPVQSASYQQCVKEKSGKRGIDLKLIFPDKDQFIIEEMGIPFVTSVILILVVGALFWRTAVSLMKEKQISEHTRDFLNNMAHEFKTPLTNIALAGKMITKDSTIGQEKKIKHYTGIILSENEKLRLQTEQVLSMTALERGEILLNKMKLDLHELIRDALKCMSLQIEYAGGDLRLNLNASHFLIIGDKSQLTNAFCNLVDNAIKYSKEKPVLSIQTSNHEENIVVAVSDRGIGIEKEFQKNIFNKFFRVPTGDLHDIKGFGLGLTYVNKIIDLHGGTIELESEKGKGATFTITMPHV